MIAVRRTGEMRYVHSAFLDTVRANNRRTDVPAVLLSRVLGDGGSSSRIMRRISSNAAFFIRLPSNGVVPVKSSYNSTPSE